MKTTKRTSTSKIKSAPKRQKRSVSESEHSDFESEEEEEPKPKPSSASRKSQTVDSDEEEKQEDDQDGEVQEEGIAAGHDSESEMSVVLDEAPPKRKKSTSIGPKTKTQPKAKAAKPAKPSELSEEEQTIKRLQGELLKCGVRKLWHRELATYDTPKAKINHLKQMLKDVGMTGRFSEQKAKAIKERRELEADLEAVQEGAKQWGDEREDNGESEAEATARPQRRAAANRFVDFGEDDDDDDDE